MPEIISDKPGYTSVRVFVELLNDVDHIVASKKSGYRSRSEFIHDALRRRIESLLSLYPELKEKIKPGEIKD